jgi:3-oxoacyl-[acyl-carrier protein] reductase
MNGKVALVTGGSSGIGEAVARCFAKEGAHVAVVASGTLAKAEKVAQDIAAGGGRATAFVCDVRDPAKIRALVSEVESTLGPIDVLVNSAGVYYATPLGGTPAEKFDQMVDINFKGTWQCIDAVAPGMIARKQGKIINFASVAGVSGLKSYSTYCATKAAIIMMTKAMARELAPHGININAIAPGNTATPMNEWVRTDADSTMRDAMLAMTPSGVLFSAAEEIAGAALFLVSPAARPMHGATMLMDEGLSTGL